MEKKSRDFLFRLLETHSPSGNETALQKEWVSFVKKFADVGTDEAGNAIGCLNKDAEFKVLLAGHGDEIAMTVSRIDENGFIRFSKSGGINTQLLPGLKVEVQGYRKKLSGVVGYSLDKDRKLPASVECKDFYIDCGAKNAAELEKFVRTGDYILYKSKPELLLNDRVCCKALDNKTGSFIVAETLRRLTRKKLRVGVYAASSAGEETNLRGAYFAGARIQPNMAIACDVTFNTDTPGEDRPERPKVELDKGPALSVGSPVNVRVNELLEKAAKKSKIGLQFELTPDRTHTDADKILFSGKGVPVALVSLPVRYMHSPIETASMNDIEAVIKLLVTMIADLSGKEDLRPLAV